MDDIAMDNELGLWDARQHEVERAEPIWSLLAYRLSRFALDLAGSDMRYARVGAETRDQLLRAVGSISANIAEGYSRASARERSRFYSFALGSTREACVWYACAGGELPDGVASARGAVLSRVRRLLLGLIRKGADPRWRSKRKRGQP